MWTESTVSEIAAEIAKCLEEGDQAMAIRLAFRIVERYDVSTLEVRDAMVSSEPGPTGSCRFDALLAALVEYSCAVRQVVPPVWVEDESRFLDEFWFIANLRGLEADALASSPISFARRGVFINSGALTYA